MAEGRLRNIPRNSGKTSLEQLRTLEVRHFKPGDTPAPAPMLYYFDHGGFRFDFLWHPNPAADRLFVLFSGDAMRRKFDPPLFQRWTWASYFPGHCLYVSDPSIYLASNLGLAWYSGTSAFDPLPVIADVVDQLVPKLEIPCNRIWTYGSSGGGFAALRMLDFIKNAGAVCVNPQTSIVAYESKSVERYLNTCFNGRDRVKALSDFPDRMSLLEQPKRFKDRSVIYVQNTLDTHHVAEHYAPFCAAMDTAPAAGYAEKNTAYYHDATFCSIVFSHSAGHAKAESAEAFSEAMAAVSALEMYTQDP